MKSLTLSLTICLILAVATIAFAGDFYVAPDGDNSTGNSWQTAYQSISEALNKMKAGDRCYLKIGSNLKQKCAGFVFAIGDDVR